MSDYTPELEIRQVTFMLEIRVSISVLVVFQPSLLISVHPVHLWSPRNGRELDRSRNPKADECRAERCQISTIFRLPSFRQWFGSGYARFGFPTLAALPFALGALPRSGARPNDMTKCEKCDKT
jgi:hypothetical protein